MKREILSAILIILLIFVTLIAVIESFKSDKANKCQQELIFMSINKTEFFFRSSDFTTIVVLSDIINRKISI